MMPNKRKDKPAHKTCLNFVTKRCSDVQYYIEQHSYSHDINLFTTVVNKFIYSNIVYIYTVFHTLHIFLS